MKVRVPSQLSNSEWPALGAGPNVLLLAQRLTSATSECQINPESLTGSRLDQEWAGDRFADALSYVAAVHAGQQKEIDGQPYIGHLLRVAGLVIEDGCTEEEAIAALLHDSLEDQGGLARLEEIRARYGDRVAEIVHECTDTDIRPKPPWRARKELYLAGLDAASDASLAISQADKLDNARILLRSYGIHRTRIWARWGHRKEDVLWYYHALARRLGELRPGPLSDEYRRVVAELDLLVGQGPTE